MYVCLCIISMVRSRRDIYKATTFFFVVRTTVVVPGMNLCPSWFRAPRIFVPGCVLSYHPCFTARKDQVSLSGSVYSVYSSSGTTVHWWHRRGRLHGVNRELL